MSQGPVRDQDAFGRQLAKKGKRKKGRIWASIGAAVGFGAVALAAWLVFTKGGRDMVTDAPSAIQAMMQVHHDPSLLFTHVGDDVVNVLLVGEDYNWKIRPVFNPHTGKSAPFQVIDTDAPPRSDTIIVLSLDKTAQTVRMLSLPRDARITYTDLDGDEHSHRKLNSVYSSGGLNPVRRESILSKVLNQEFGIRIDRYAIIKPNSFKELVKLVNGVYVNVDGALKLDRRTGKLYRGHIHYKDNWGQWSVDLDPGPQWLDPDQAHGYVRFRHDREGDPGRIRRQQTVMKALVKRIMHKNPLQMPTLMRQIREQFVTNMSEPELMSLAYFARSMGEDIKIQPMTLYGIYASNGDIILNRPKNVKLLTALFGSAFNPDHFLQRSPSTNGDDIGPANNASPATQAILLKAGLLTNQAKLAEKNSMVLDAPVRPGDKYSVKNAKSTGSTDSGGSDEPDATEAEASQTPPPRRHRLKRHHEAETPTASAPSSAEPVRNHEDAAAQDDSPVPAPDDGNTARDTEPKTE